MVSKVFDIKENKINGGSKTILFMSQNSSISVNTKIINKTLSSENKLKLNKVSTFVEFFKEN